MTLTPPASLKSISTWRNYAAQKIYCSFPSKAEDKPWPLQGDRSKRTEDSELCSGPEMNMIAYHSGVSLESHFSERWLPGKKGLCLPISMQTYVNFSNCRHSWSQASHWLSFVTFPLPSAYPHFLFLSPLASNLLLTHSVTSGHQSVQT